MTQTTPQPDFDPRIATLLNELLTKPGRAAKALGPYANSLHYVTAWLTSGIPADNQMKALLYDSLYKVVLLSFALGILVNEDAEKQ